MDRPLADAATGLLTPGGPIGIMLGTTALTRDGWGLGAAHLPGLRERTRRSTRNS